MRAIVASTRSIPGLSGLPTDAILSGVAVAASLMGAAWLLSITLV